MKSLDNLNDWLDIQTHQRLGEILVQADCLSLDDLGIALDIQNFDSLQAGIQLGNILLNMKAITSEQLEKALLIQAGIKKNIEKNTIGEK